MHVQIPTNIGIGLIGLSYPLGSFFEEKGKYGTSHLMEHLMCKTFDDLRPKLKRLGIDHNAFTSTNKIVFHFTGLVESLEKMGQIVYDRITDSKNTPWSEEDFNNEKRTVIQEYEDCFNDQCSGIYHNMLRKHYKEYGAIGLRTDIENFTYQESLDAIKSFSYPQLVCEVGGNYIDKNKIPDIDSTNPKQKSFFGKYKVPIETVPKEGKTFIGLLGKNVLPFNTDKKLKTKTNVAFYCLNSGLESPLYQVIREQTGLSYFSWAWATNISSGGVPMFGALTSNKNAKTLQSVYSDFFDGDLSRHISKTRFEECYEGILIEKKILQLLPHNFAADTILGETTYDGLEDLSYEELIDFTKETFNIKNFQPIKY